MVARSQVRSLGRQVRGGRRLSGTTDACTKCSLALTTSLHLSTETSKRLIEHNPWLWWTTQTGRLSLADFACHSRDTLDRTRHNTISDAQQPATQPAFGTNVNAVRPHFSNIALPETTSQDAHVDACVRAPTPRVVSYAVSYAATNCALSRVACEQNTELARVRPSLAECTRSV